MRIKLINKTNPEPIKPNILDPKFKYVPACSTDIRKTWEKFGFKVENK